MITLDEAIKRLTQRVAWLAQWENPEDLEDMRLGIEALKWRKHCEAVNRPERYPPLPGETEE
jgi:hypothetical protein